MTLYNYGNYLSYRLPDRKYEEAIKCYDKALEIEPNNTSILREKSHALSCLNKYNEAIKCLDKALEIEPSNPDIWMKKGFITYCSSGTHDEKALREAIKYYDKALEIEPNNTYLWYEKGEFLCLPDNILYMREAIDCYRKALEIDPSNSSAEDGLKRAKSRLAPYGGY